MNSSTSRVIHSRFVKTPLITDTLMLQCFRRGQWVRLAWLDKPSRYWGMNERGNVIAFHYPKAFDQFSAYCAPDKETRLRRMEKLRASRSI